MEIFICLSLITSNVEHLSYAYWPSLVYFSFGLFLFVCFQFFCCFVFSLEILPVKLIASFLEDHRNSIQTSFMAFPDEGNCIS